MCQFMGIDIGNCYDVMVFQVRREVFGIMEVVGNQWQVVNYQILCMYLRRFFIGVIGVDIVNMGISKSNDLMRIGRISEDFLIIGY